MRRSGLRFAHGVALAAVGLLLLTSACKKTVEGESKAFEANQAKVKELAVHYPGLKVPLEARLKAASAAFEEAKGASDEKAKVEKMNAANKKLMGGFVGDLQGLDTKVKALRSKAVDAATRSSDESDRLGAKVASESATKVLDQVEASLKAGGKDEASAAALVKKALSDLDAAGKDLDKVLASSKGKTEAKTKGEAEAKATKAKEEAKTAPWKCGYCGRQNDHALTGCGGCGAPRGGADKKKK